MQDFHPRHLLGDGGIIGTGREHRLLARQFSSTRFAAQPVDGKCAGGTRDPAGGVGRQAVARPLAQRDGERILDSIFGKVDVTEDTDKRGHGSAGRLAEDPVNLSLIDLCVGIDVVQGC